MAKNDPESEKTQRIQMGIPGSLNLLGAKKADSNSEKNGHIFISYQWHDQKMALQINQRLKADGYKTWIDVENKEGSTLDAMAGAVENAALVLICASEKYKLSPNCRTEGQYTFQRKKPFIPLMMQRGYLADGWLGALMGAKLYINFDGKYEFEEAYQMLVKEMSHHIKTLNPGTVSEVGTDRDWGKGDATASDWTEEEKRGLTESNSLRIIYMGDLMAGKTSLVRTIISGGSYMSQVDDRTVIAEINHWVPDPKQRKTFSMVDLGGHQSYLSSGHYFHTNSPNNVSTLCHDITNVDYLRSFLWIKSFMTRSPESHIIAALTQCDKLEQKDRTVKLDNFLKEVSKYLSQEIESLEDTIAMAQSNKSSKVGTFKDLKGL